MQLGLSSFPQDLEKYSPQIYSVSCSLGQVDAEDQDQQEEGQQGYEVEKYTGCEDIWSEVDHPPYSLFLWSVRH